MTETRWPLDDRRRINGHILELQEVEWRCIHCHHWFDAASDANGWFCGDPCVHPIYPTDPRYVAPVSS